MSRPASSALFLGAFALYLVTLHPAYQLDDSPWTVAACLGLGTQHAPGYPLLTLLGRLAACLPVGGIYQRINLLAAALGAAGAVGAAWLAAGLRGPRPGARAAGWLAGAALAVTGVWWECALSAKGAVYLLNAVLLAGATSALLPDARPRPAQAAFLLGLALANHWMSAVCWLPVAALLLRPWPARRALLAAALLAPGGALYLQLPLCAARDPGWGDPVTWTGWLDVILRRTFLAQAALKPAGMTPLQVLWELFAPWREAGGLVFVAAGAGVLVLPPRARTPLLIPVALLLAAVAAVSNPVHVITGEWLFWLADRFLLPWHLTACVLAGLGAAAVLTALPPAWRRPAAVAALLVLTLGGAARLERNDHARDYLGFDYAENLRTSLSARCAVLAEADYQCFPLVALGAVEERTPGMTFVITNPFLNRTWGWRRLARRLPREAAAGAAATAVPLTGRPDAAAGARLAALADRLGLAALVLHLPLCSYPELRARLRWRGLLYAVEPGPPPAPPGEPDTARRFARFRLRGLHARMPWKDDAAFSVLDIYGQARAAPGAAAMAAGRWEDALAAARRGLAFPGRTGTALLWAAAGQAAARLNRFADAEAAFRLALALRPRDLDLLTNVATACAAQGRADEAMRYFALVLARDPGNAAARGNLALLRRQL